MKSTTIIVLAALFAVVSSRSLVKRHAQLRQETSEDLPALGNGTASNRTGNATEGGNQTQPSNGRGGQGQGRPCDDGEALCQRNGGGNGEGNNRNNEQSENNRQNENNGRQASDDGDHACDEEYDNVWGLPEFNEDTCWLCNITNATTLEFYCEQKDGTVGDGSECLEDSACVAYDAEYDELLIWYHEDISLISDYVLVSEDSDLTNYWAFGENYGSSGLIAINFAALEEQMNPVEFLALYVEVYK